MTARPVPWPNWFPTTAPSTPPMTAPAPVPSGRSRIGSMPVIAPTRLRSTARGAGRRAERHRRERLHSPWASSGSAGSTRSIVPASSARRRCAARPGRRHRRVRGRRERARHRRPLRSTGAPRPDGRRLRGGAADGRRELRRFGAVVRARRRRARRRGDRALAALKAVTLKGLRDGGLHRRSPGHAGVGVDAIRVPSTMRGPRRESCPMHAVSPLCGERDPRCRMEPTSLPRDAWRCRQAVTGCA